MFLNKYFLLLVVLSSNTLSARPGHVDFMEASKLKPLKEALPNVTDKVIQNILKSPDTMWYDEESMVFAYQDSIETVVGLRANSVGRIVGEANRDSPDISRLLNFFGEDERFRFPFRTAAGTDDIADLKVVNFWSPPRNTFNKVIPVKWWKKSPRGRWHWVFPINTTFGEVLYQKSSSGKYYVFEIRIRKRYQNGWDVDVFRPFRKSTELVRAIQKLRPDWKKKQNLVKVIDHLKDRSTLQDVRLDSKPYEKALDPIEGSLDYLPDFQDEPLVIDLLTKFTFQSTEGRIWKENATQETYAPSSNSSFSVVPKNYKMGLIPVNEISCNRCHDQTGRGLGDFDGKVILYGEIWGEDRAFTWHLFKPNPGMYNTFDDADGSRIINPKLVDAGLILQKKPSANDPLYFPLKTWELLED